MTLTDYISIAVGSDLHIEHEPNYQYFQQGADEGLHPIVGPNLEELRSQYGYDHLDVVILAGDIAVGAKHTVQYAKAVSAYAGVPVILIAGNHEYYGHCLNTELEQLRALSREVSMAPGPEKVYFLENNSIEINEVVFIGATLWTDFMAAGNMTKGMQSFTQLNDSHVIDVRNESFDTGDLTRKLRAADVLYRHRDSLGYITNKLVECKKQGKKVVIVTHHAPSKICDLDPPTSLSPCFVSNLEYLMNHVEYSPDAWIAGHTHTKVDEIIGNTRMVVNCRGYYQIEPQTKWFQWKMIEV